MGLPGFITKNRHGTYYFRLVIPKDLKRFFPLGQREIRRSLGTGNKREAIRLARVYWTGTILNFERMRDLEENQIVSNDDAKEEENKPGGEDLANIMARVHVRHAKEERDKEKRNLKRVTEASKLLDPGNPVLTDRI